MHHMTICRAAVSGGYTGEVGGWEGEWEGGEGE